ncbi:Di-copper centre-containing protein [Auricularia subglabra TFB-10046 SS5]|nr:Di-copper centre-containing protein [Auricularia subglabra TFB-10046 SS5]
MSSNPIDPTYIVTGREGTYPRLNLLDLHKNHPEQFSLFILALTAIQYPDQTVPTLPPSFKPESIVPEGGTWFNLGGIHGIPYSRYPGDPASGDLSDKGAAVTAAAATAAAAPPAQKPAQVGLLGLGKTTHSPGAVGGLFGNVAAGLGQAAGGVVHGALDVGAGVVGGAVHGALDVGTGVVGGVATALGGTTQVLNVDPTKLLGASPLNLLGAGTTTAPPPVQTASTAPPGEKRYGGYCNHASVLFPPWHRPYLLALEQSIGIAATNIGKTCKYLPSSGTSGDLRRIFFGESDGLRESPESLRDFPMKIAEQIVQGLPAAKAAKWSTAAKELRWPFWDWTDPITLKEGFPKIIKEDYIKIVTPAGNTETVPNPMSHYRFPTPLNEQFEDIIGDVPFTDGKVQQKAYFSKWDRTYRWPGATPTPSDDYAKVDQELKRLYADLRAKVAHLFTYESEPDPAKWSLLWDEMSNTTVQSDPSKGGSTNVSKSLEASHNSIHIIVGGVGHMGQNDYAGFDPIFWLHHANVDRIYALWEYCYKDYWVGAGYNDKETGQFKYFTQPTGGTYYQLDHTRLDQATDMLPFVASTRFGGDVDESLRFRKARDAYWTPMDARSLEVGRPDVFPKHYTYPVVDGVDVSKTVSDRERVKYRSVLQKHFGLRETVDKSKNRTRTHPSPLFSNPITDILIPGGISAVQNYRHFIVSVMLNEHAYNDSYSFEFSYQHSPEEAPVESHVAVLSRPKNTGCAACQGRYAEGNLVRGMIHIPSHHVVTLLNNLVSGRPTDRGERDEADVIKSSFTARLVGRGGHVFATARAGQVVAEADRLDAVITPSVKFLSAYAGLDSLFGEEGPLSFFGWQDHEEVFAGCWKKGA